MADATTYDDVIIGAGQAGVPWAVALARAGRRVALAERRHVGGTCINVGCTPTKTMIASARVAHVVRRAADYGVHAGPVTVDMAAVRARKDRVVHSFRESGRRRVLDAGVELIEGTASFLSAHDLAVKMPDGGDRRVRAGRVFVNAGSRPRVPDLPGLGNVPYLDSTTIMELGRVPAHLIIVGGGYVGLEFAQMFRRYGSQVTIIHRHGQVLPNEDADVAEEMVRILREDGIRVILSSHPLGVERVGAVPGPCAGERSACADAIRLVAQGTDGRETVSGSHLLLAAGRVPNTEELNLAAAGVPTDERGHIRVNGRLETGVPGIWAMGDVKGGPAFTHIAYDDYRILCANLLEGREATVSDRIVPYTVFTDPQLGRVGLTEKEARERVTNVRVARMPMSYVARAIEIDETRGLMKAVVDGDTDRILGCAVLGPEGGEIMAVVEVAMMGGLPYTALREAVFAHPTLAESLNGLFSSWAPDSARGGPAGSRSMRTLGSGPCRLPCGRPGATRCRDVPRRLDPHRWSAPAPWCCAPRAGYHAFGCRIRLLGAAGSTPSDLELGPVGEERTRGRSAVGGE